MSFDQAPTLAQTIVKLPLGWFANFVQNAPMPIDVKIPSTVAKPSSVGVSVMFFDNATGTPLASGGGFSLSPLRGVATNTNIKSDFTTGYNASDTQEFQHVNGDMS
jgi:hypothetical protein